MSRFSLSFLLFLGVPFFGAYGNESTEVLKDGSQRLLPGHTVCGVTLSKDGAIHFEGLSYESAKRYSKARVYESPSGRYRLYEAEFPNDPGSVAALADTESGHVRDTFVGKYGSTGFILWGEDERYAALACASDGALALYFVELATGRSGCFRFGEPDDGGQLDGVSFTDDHTIEILETVLDGQGRHPRRTLLDIRTVVVELPRDLNLERIPAYGPATLTKHGYQWEDETTKLSTDQSLTWSTWAPDRKLAVAHEYQHNPVLHLLRIGESGPDVERVLIEMEAQFLEGFLRLYFGPWSANGRYLALWIGENSLSLAADGLTLYLFDVQTKALQPLARSLLEDRYLSWHPDGKQLFFTAGGDRFPNAGKRLMCYNLETSELTPFATGGLIPADLACSPDGESLAFSAFRNGEKPLQVFSLNLATNTVTQISEGTNPCSFPHWGKHDPALRYYRIMNDGGDLMRHGNGETSVLIQVNERPESGYSCPDWLPVILENPLGE